MIIYADSGAGHRRAAEALYQVAGKTFPDAEIRLFDILEYTTAVFRKTYPRTYLLMVNHCPWLWGLFYHSLDYRVSDRVARRFRRVTNAKHCQAFEQYILAEQPDLVLTTHFLPNEVITHLKRKHGFKTFLATCITDYYPHEFWRDDGVDIYFTPHEDLTPTLLEMGIPAGAIYPSGIPIDPVFRAALDRNAIRQKLNLTDMPTVLVASGGFGVGPVEELVTEIEQVERSLQVLVICGKNDDLKEKLTAATIASRHRFAIFGFVNNMHELMSVSDVMISKSGGLTSTEAMAKGLPLIVLYPIPGQESGNCEFLSRHGAGLEVANPRQAREALEHLFEHPHELLQIRDNMSRLGRPEAAREIVEYLAKITKQVESR